MHLHYPAPPLHQRDPPAVAAVLVVAVTESGHTDPENPAASHVSPARPDHTNPLT
ncbi:hypothetical protein HanPSC8_Chr08g0337061 [Helianthus annuus]|nr:hypothetical protein HanPSC8_Chr08g0337061 [Helianthus annuus]